MELKPRTESLFLRFATQGTLGEGAVRSPLSFTDKMEASAYPMAMDMLVSYDNVAGLDHDDRAGFVRFDRAQLERKMNGEVEQGFQELVGPAPALTPEKQKEMREELQELVTNGVMTQAEVDAIVAGGSEQPAVKQGESFGQLAKTGESLQGWIESTGDERDIEFIASGPNGFTFLNVTPRGEDRFEARAVHVDAQSDASYKETFSGTWNLIGA